MMWKAVREGAAPESIPGAARPDQTSPTPARTQNERKEARISAKFSAAIRHPFLGEEIVSTENVSPGGLCIRSVRRYRPETLVEVAFPYTPGGANVFTAARFVHVNPLAGEQAILYGLEYIAIHKGWPRKQE